METSTAKTVDYQKYLTSTSENIFKFKEVTENEIKLIYNLKNSKTKGLD